MQLLPRLRAILVATLNICPDPECWFIHIWVLKPSPHHWNLLQTRKSPIINPMLSSYCVYLSFHWHSHPCSYYTQHVTAALTETVTNMSLVKFKALSKHWCHCSLSQQQATNIAALTAAAAFALSPGEYGPLWLIPIPTISLTYDYQIWYESWCHPTGAQDACTWHSWC